MEAKEPVEKLISDYIKENFDYSIEVIQKMRLSEKMSIVEFRDKDKWNEFKVGLRESGYII